MLNGFEHWLLSNNCYVKRGDDDQSYTHLLLSGGKLRIDSDKTHDFLKLYSQYLDSKQKLYVIEMKTPIFSFILDLDFFQHIPLNAEIIKNYIETIQKSIWNIVISTHTQNEARVVCCMTENKKIMKNDEQFIKTGIHLYWPNIYTTTEIALMLRNVIIDKLSLQFGERHEQNPWSDVIDKTVLERNGLRMIGSRKLSSCSFCKTSNIDRSSCKMCYGTGKIDEGRAYYPFMIIDGKGREMKQCLLKLKKNTMKTMEETSIRTEYTQLPKVFDNNIPERYKSKVKSSKQIEQHKDIHSLTKGKYTNKESVPHDSKLFKMCETFIKSNFPQKDYTVIEIFKPAKDKKFYIIQTNSKFCMNVGRDHKNNHIFFYLDKSYAYQKCHCTCDTVIGRLNGKCSDYKSAHRKLPHDLQKLLYPSEKDRLGILFEIPPLNKIGNSAERKKHIDSLQSYADILLNEVCKRSEMENKKYAIYK